MSAPGEPSADKSHYAWQRLGFRFKARPQKEQNKSLGISKPQKISQMRFRTRGSEVQGLSPRHGNRFGLRGYRSQSRGKKRGNYGIKYSQSIATKICSCNIVNPTLPPLLHFFPVNRRNSTHFLNTPSSTTNSRFSLRRSNYHRGSHECLEIR